MSLMGSSLGNSKSSQEWEIELRLRWKIGTKEAERHFEASSASPYGDSIAFAGQKLPL